jgi:hypothetical protein
MIPPELIAYLLWMKPKVSSLIQTNVPKALRLMTTTTTTTLVCDSSHGYNMVSLIYNFYTTPNTKIHRCHPHHPPNPLIGFLIAIAIYFGLSITRNLVVCFLSMLVDLCAYRIDPIVCTIQRIDITIITQSSSFHQ